MSLHFELFLAMDLKPDTPQNILNILEYMTHSEDTEFKASLPSDFLNEVDDWLYILRKEEARIPGELGSVFRRAYRYTQSGQDVYRYTLGFRVFLLDDYFYEVYESFLKWLAQYSETTGFVGYWREEADLHPILIYFKNGKVYFSEKNDRPLEITEGEAW